MNKVKFNHGGQPVYLDDLSAIQALASETLPEVLEFIAQSDIWRSAENWKSDDALAEYVPMGTVSPFRGYWLSLFFTFTITGSKIRIAFAHGGYVSIGGEILHFEDTDIEVDYGSPFYVIVKEEDTDIRTLENGEMASCGMHKYAVLSSERSVSDECYSSAEMYNLMDAVHNIVKAKRVYEENRWIPLNVDFYHGYSGTVEYCELADRYRFHIDISSTDATSIYGSFPLFRETSLPINYQHVISGLVATGGDDVCYASCIKFNSDNDAILLPLESVSHGCWSPAECPVNVIFEVPKAV